MNQPSGASDLNDSFPNPFVYFNSLNPYPSIYLQPENGHRAPFGRTPPEPSTEKTDERLFTLKSDERWRVKRQASLIHEFLTVDNQFLSRCWNNLC